MIEPPPDIRSANRSLPVLGMLMLDGPYMAVPNAMAHPTTFDAHVLYRVVANATGARVAGYGYREVGGLYEELAERLCWEGADILTANCGFAVAFQEMVRERSQLPTILSSLPLHPLLQIIHGSPVGILTFDAAQIDDDRRAAAGWSSPSSIPMADMQHSPTWRALSTDNPSHEDVRLMREEIVEVATVFAAKEGLTALLLECTGMCVFARDIAVASGVATYGVVDLIRFVLSAMPRSASSRQYSTSEQVST